MKILMHAREIKSFYDKNNRSAKCLYCIVKNKELFCLKSQNQPIIIFTCFCLFISLSSMISKVNQFRISFYFKFTILRTWWWQDNSERSIRRNKATNGWIFKPVQRDIGDQKSFRHILIYIFVKAK